VPVCCVEPEGWDDMTRSLEAGEILEVGEDAPPTSCDALQTTRVSPITFGILAANGARGVAVSESEIAAAVRFAWRELGLVVEPGGAVALAAVLSGKVAAAPDLVLILSGGNVDPEAHARLTAGTG
jgi:threonine dehydratase